MRYKWTILIAAMTLFSVLCTAAYASAAEPVFGSTNGSFPITFSSSKAKVTLVGASGSKVTCESETMTGELTSRTEVRKVVQTLKGCSTIYLKTIRVRCGNATETTIQTVSLKGHLGYIDKTEEPVGLELESETAPGPGEEPLWAEFTCGFESTVVLHGEVRGHIIGRMEAKTAEAKTTLTLQYSQASGKQTVSGFEGGASNQQLQWRLWETSPGSYENVGVENTAGLTSFKNASGGSTAIYLANSSALEPVFKFTNGQLDSTHMGTFSSSKGGTSFVSASGTSWTCESETGSGEINKTELRKFVETFKNCRIGSGYCGNVEGKTIQTNVLRGRLGYIDKSAEPVGVELEQEVNSGEEPVWAEFPCSLATTVIRGHLIGRVNVKLAVPETSLSVTIAQSAGKQAIGGFEGGPTKQQMQWTFGGGAYENLGIGNNTNIASIKNSKGETTEIEIVEA